MPDLESWVALTLVPEVGPAAIRRVITRFGTPSAVFDAPLEKLAEVEGLGERKARLIREFNGWQAARAHLATIRNMGGQIVTTESPEYPLLLRQIEHAPPLLYVLGAFIPEDRFGIAVVGSRGMSQYGRLVAEKLSGELAAAGITIVSGMARGIDTVAHSTAIRKGGRTIAVLGSGLDIVYPPENLDIRDRISRSGCVVSEFPPGTRPGRENFPIRNRLISGLSLGVLVVEAGRESGALITARCALEQNREVFAVPGSILSSQSAGTNSLIRSGAKPVEKGSDIIEELAPVLRGFVRAPQRAAVALSGPEERLCRVLSGEPLHVDSIARELSMPAAEVLAVLLGLELKGVVRQTEGKRFYLAQ